MLSAVKVFIIPVVAVVATAHTAMSVAQYHRIKRLSDEVDSLQKELYLLNNSYDMCTTQREARDNEIATLKGLVDMLVDKGGGDICLDKDIEGNSHLP